MPTPPEDYKGKKIPALPYDQNNKAVPALFVPIVDPGDESILGYLPLKATNNGDGTATLHVDTEITAVNPNLTIGNVKVGSSDAQNSGNRWLKVDGDGTIHVRLTADDIALATEAKQDAIIAKLDVTLGTRASETTLATAVVTLGDILTTLNALDVDLSTRASEATLVQVRDYLDTVETKLQSFIDSAAKPANSSVTTVARSAANVTLLAANASRKGATIHNDAVALLYVKFGATASTSSFTTRLGNQDYFEVPFGYTGRIDGIWASGGAGDAKITELT